MNAKEENKGSWHYPLFELLANQHDLILTNSELDDIINCVSTLKSFHSEDKTFKFILDNRVFLTQAKDGQEAWNKLCSRFETDYNDLKCRVEFHGVLDFGANDTIAFRSEVNYVEELSTRSEWIKVEDILPTIEEHGKKVLIFRQMNVGQKSQSISIYDTIMVKHCEDGTLWTILPSPPNA